MMIIDGPGHQLLKAWMANLDGVPSGTGTWRGSLQNGGSWIAEIKPANFVDKTWEKIMIDKK